MTRQRFFAILRTLLSLAVASIAINWVLAQAGANLTHEFLNCNYWWLLAAVLLTVLGTALSSYRWCSLLALQEVHLRQWDCFRLTMIGVFFNLVGLGGVGGDVLKMVYVRQHAGPRAPEAVLSILVDRILGLLGLFLVAMISLPFVWDELARSPSFVRRTAGFVVLIAIVGGSSVALVLGRDYWLPRFVKQAIRNYARRFPERLVSIIGRVVRSLDLYRNQLPQLLKALAISACIHTSATIGIYCIGQAFRIDSLAPRHYFLSVQVANTISAVPITPGGLGSRDVVLLEFFKAMGADRRANLVPPVYSCLLVFWSLVGGLFFLTEKQVVPTQADIAEDIT